MTGVLRPGDQLPTVKDVVATLAINPNTVLKAYRELEHAGLAEGRQGIGRLRCDGQTGHLPALICPSDAVSPGGSKKRGRQVSTTRQCKAC